MISKTSASLDKKYRLLSFLLPFLSAAVILLPFVLQGAGILYIFTDFNLQQLPFNMLSNQAVKSGNIFWSPLTDLGGSLIGSYSFYTLGSPFFWLSALFPPAWFPYLAAPLLMLKIGVAGFASYCYIGRFVGDRRYALLAALLYALSGFQIGNLFYNHFLDVTALFPLLLIALEEAMAGGRRGVFALAVAVNALTNYEFFVGEVVFLVIYFICRVSFRGRGGERVEMSWRRFALLAAESLIGVGLAGVLLIPSAMFTLEIPRATKTISGLDALFYHPSVYLSLLKALLLPAEAADHSVITASGWSSTEAWLPVFGMTPAAAYLLGGRKSWVSRLLAASCVIALVPALNSLFYLLNGEYYSRWFYMPILIAALACAKAFDEGVGMRRGAAATAALWVLFLGGLALASVRHQVIYSRPYLLFQAGLAGASLLILLGLTAVREKKCFLGLSAAAVIAAGCASGIFTVWADRRDFPPAQVFTSIYTHAAQTVKLPVQGNERVDTTNCYYNTNLPLGLPSVDFFSSTVQGSVFSFYRMLGIERVNNSSPDFGMYGLRPLLSVKYILALHDGSLPSFLPKSVEKLPSLQKLGQQGAYDVYENKDFIPMGFAFDSCVTQSQLERLSPDVRHLALLHALVLTPRQAARYSDCIRSLPDSGLKDFSLPVYRQDVVQRRAESCYSFRYTRTGFTAGIDLGADRLVFFSVPFDTGWSATVNGAPARVEEVDGGLMAVRAQKGDNRIAFRYRAPGLSAGVGMTAVSAVLLVLLLLSGRMAGRLRANGKAQPAKADGSAE